MKRGGKGSALELDKMCVEDKGKQWRLKEGLQVD